MKRTSSKSRSLKVQREVVRVLSAEHLAGVGGGDLIITFTRDPVVSVCRLVGSCHPDDTRGPLFRDPIFRDPIFRSGNLVICP